MRYPIHRGLLIIVLLSLLSTAVIAQTPRRSMLWDGIQREYLMHIPSQHIPGAPLPVLYFLHGMGGDISRYDSWYDLQAVSDRYGWIIVLPQALSCSLEYLGYPFDLGSTWNAGIEVSVGELHYALNSEIDDEGFLMALFDTIDSQYPINRDSLFVSGISLGGFMTHRMAIKQGDHIAGFCAINGLIPLPYTNRQPVAPVNMLQIHGTNDEVISFDGNLTIPIIGSIKIGLGVDSVISYWVNNDHCTNTPIIDSLPDRINDGMRFVRFTYDGGENNTQVQFLKVIGGEHEWYADDQLYDVDYMVEMHDFFCHHQQHFSAIEDIQPSTFKFHLYPNPATDHVTISGLPAGTTVYLYNITGLLISEYNIHQSPLTIDLSSLSSGLYLLRSSNGSIQKLNIISNHE